jgi:hypothetical protein
MTDARPVFDYFETLDDPQVMGRTLYPLMEILLLTLGGVLFGAEDWVSIVEWGEMKLDWLRRFLPYERGNPPRPTCWAMCLPDWTRRNSSSVLESGYKRCVWR